MGRQADKQDSDMLAEVLSGIITQSDNSPKPQLQHRRFSIPFRKIGIIFCVLLLIASSVVLARALLRSESPAPVKLASISPTVQYTLYFPDDLPEGQMIDETTINQDNGVIFYEILLYDKRVYVSLQPLPDPPPAIANTENNSGIREISTVYGNATLGTFRGAPAGIMLTDNTLININADKDVSIDQIAAIIEKLRPID